MRYLVLALAIVFAIVPFFTPFDGFDPERYPMPQRDPAIQPAGWAFSIWGIIYLGLIVHAAIGVTRGDAAGWRESRAPLAVSLAVGAIWLPVAGVSPVWATVLIWVMLIGALMALFAGRRAGEPWRVDLPLGLYAGWLSAASFVSLALLGAGWGVLFDDLGWARVLLPVAVGFAALMLWSMGFVPGYAAAVAWALVGIVAKSWGVHMDVALMALAGIAALGGVLLATTRRKSA